VSGAPARVRLAQAPAAARTDAAEDLMSPVTANASATDRPRSSHASIADGGSANASASTRMIARYTHPEMGRIWSDQRRYETWLLVEAAAAEAMARTSIERLSSPPRSWLGSTEPVTESMAKKDPRRDSKRAEA